MSPQTQPQEPEERRSSAIRIPLVGSCGHEITVLIRDRGDDLERISKAMREGASEALLVRFCPYCVENREFAFPLESFEPRLESPVEPAQFSFSSPSSGAGFDPRPEWALDPSLPPTEVPFRYWENGRKHLTSEKVRERELGERELKLVADIFDRQRKTMQHEAVLKELASFYDSRGRSHEADEILEKTQRPTISPKK